MNTNTKTMPRASVPDMRADAGTAVTRRTSKPRPALGPIASNTSSFAEVSECATPHGGRGSSFGLATAESSPDSVDRRDKTAPVRRCAREAPALRYRHDPYAGIGVMRVPAAPSHPPGYQWCGPGVNLHAAPATATDSRTAASATALTTVPLAGPADAAPTAAAAPTTAAAAPTTAAAAPTTAAAAPTTIAAGASMATAPPVPATPTAPSAGRVVGGPSGSRALHDTSMSSDASEPSMRPKYEGRRAVPVRSSLVATVQFRCRTEEFHVPAEVRHACEPDAVVVVQGDRGEDAGTVLRVDCVEPYAVPQCAVKRAASAAEVCNMRAASLCADDVLAKVRELVKDEATRDAQFEQLSVVDVDVQMDLQKVFVHYTSPWRVRFGTFTKRMWHSLPFKARIWMNQVNYAGTENMPTKARMAVRERAQAGRVARPQRHPSGVHREASVHPAK